MPLRLQVVSAHRESMGGSYIQDFKACGGYIGRSLDCDWALPDSKRYISSKHAMIDYQDGLYYLVDLSRNGVFLNGADTPVGQGNPQRLFDGDILRLGEFEIRAALIEDDSECGSDGMQDSVVRAQLVREDESQEVTLLPVEQISEDLSLEDVLTPGDMPGELSALSEIPAEASAILRRMANEEMLKEITHTFLKAAGLSPTEFEGLDLKVLLQNAGRLLGEFTEGTHALLVEKDRITRGLHLHRAAGDGMKNPLRASDGLDNALRLLLGNGNDVTPQGPKAVESAFDELRQHQKGVITAMRTGLADYLGYFEPEAIEQQSRPDQRKEFRDMYADAYAGLARPNHKKLPQRFDEEFSRAYELETGD
jgi:type VI secretion system protein ImpI